jgi:hypothetical protein
LGAPLRKCNADEFYPARQALVELWLRASEYSDGDENAKLKTTARQWPVQEQVASVFDSAGLQQCSRLNAAPEIRSICCLPILSVMFS